MIGFTQMIGLKVCKIKENAIPENLSISINGVINKPKNFVINLGTTIVNKLNFESHINSTCKSQVASWMHYLNWKVF